MVLHKCVMRLGEVKRHITRNTMKPIKDSYKSLLTDWFKGLVDKLNNTPKYSGYGYEIYIAFSQSSKLFLSNW